MPERDLAGLGENLANPETSSESTEESETDGTTATTAASSTPSACQAITRDGTQCDHKARPDSQYCKKHQPNEFGELPGEFKRKQWNLSPDVLDALFDDAVTSDSVYLDMQRELGVEIPKKSFENTAGEFLLEFREELIDFATDKYANTD